MAYIIYNTSTSLVSFGCFPRLVMHHSNGRSWAVPLSFDFTEVSNMWNAWRKWWLGKNDIDGGKHYKIMAYCHLRNKDMPTTKAKNSLKTNWRPILTKMIQIPGLNVNRGFVQDDAVLKESYTAALNCLRSRFSFLFVSSDGAEILTKWSLSTWSKRTQPAYARTNGTENNKSQLLEPTKRNQSHKGEKTFTMVHDKPRKTPKRH